MKNLARILALVLVIVMMIPFIASCGKKPSGDPNNNNNNNNNNNDNEQTNTTPLVVAYSNFSEKFTPFYADTAYDQDVAGMVSLGLLVSDRGGNVLLNAMNGETVSYNGTDYTYYSPANCVVTENQDGSVLYSFTLKEGLKFSDGKPVTMKDVLFSMYVLSDPAYDGSSTFWNLPIEGMAAYRSGMESAYKLLAAAGKENTDFSIWTEADQTEFWQLVEQAGVKYAETIAKEIYAKYGAAYGVSNTIADCAGFWGFELEENATAEDFWAAILETYGYDFSDKGFEAEACDTSYASVFASLDGGKFTATALQTGDSAATISGITYVDETHLTVKMTEVSAVAIYQLGVTIAPLHYYGSEENFDIAQNKFGFTKGNLTSVHAKDTIPLGAGPYKFLKYENGVVSFEANENYFTGVPKTKYVQFKEGADTDKLSGITAGTIDVSDPSFSNTVIAAIKAANSNGQLFGNKITTSLVDNLGYGYIGICADTVKIGDKDSAESKALRKAFATVLSVYRDLSVDSYYGDRAVVINYPISNTSWAAPQVTDDGYAVAYSKDAHGNSLFNSTMTAEQRYAAALQGALTWFEAAGYTVADGRVTAAPAGAKLSYEVQIPADGTGDHPSFMILTEAKKALATIGIELIVTDLANSSDLWDALDAGTCEMWCAAWGSTVDPDMTQVYNSANTSGSNHYRIADEQLDTLMANALKTTNQATRKVLYKQCLDIILDWGVEVPTYQRKNAVIFSSERVNLDTVTKDITPFYGWLSEIDKIELK